MADPCPDCGKLDAKLAIGRKVWPEWTPWKPLTWFRWHWEVKEVERPKAKSREE